MKKGTSGLLIVTILFVIILAGLGYGYSVYSGYQKEYAGTETKEGTDVVIEIPQGSSTKAIAQILKEHGLIKYPSAFVKRVKESEYRGVLQYGTFTLNTGMNTWQMIEIIGAHEEAAQAIGKITIPEGFSVEMIAARAAEQGICTQEEFLQAANAVDYQYDFLADIPADAKLNYKLQGFLFPATYDIYEGMTARDLVEDMLEAFAVTYNSSMRSKAAELGYTAFEVVTRASIVEREAKVTEERPIIAGVINNRLAIDMPLQMCPTALYPVTKGMYDKGEVLIEDTQYDSPYNTYVYEGLPVGPICNPGAASISAVLNAEVHEYLYYHVDDPNVGNHIFTKDYQEHLNTQ